MPPIKYVGNTMFRFLYSIHIIFLLTASNSISAQGLYNTNWTKSGTIYGGTAVLLAGSLLIEEARGPITQEDIQSLDKLSINGFDREISYKYSEEYNTASDYLRNGLYITPLAFLISKKGRQNAGELLIMYSEVFAINLGLTSIAKSGLGRYRPYAYNENVPLELKLSSTTRRSFFSGHTSKAASISFFTATILDDFFPESKWRYAVWTGAITLPALVGYLRVKAGRHFPSDVIVGYGVGALVGYLVPALHRRKSKLNIDLISSDNGLGLVYHF